MNLSEAMFSIHLEKAKPGILQISTLAGLEAIKQKSAFLLDVLNSSLLLET